MRTRIPPVSRKVPCTGGWRRRGATAAGVLVMAASGLALAACGIPTQATAHALAVTPKVNASAPGASTTARPTRSGLLPVTVFFIAKGAYVVPAPRYVKPPASVATAVDTLLAGPTTHELYSEGLTTALSPSIKLLHTTRRTTHTGTVEIIDFTTHFGSLSGTQEVLGVAQVVFTVSETVQPNIGVLFEIDTIPIPVPIASGGGGLDGSPVHQSDYASLRPATTPSTTTATTAPH